MLPDPDSCPLTPVCSDRPFAMPSPVPAVGIDLGTTYSAIARLDETGRPVTLVNAEGDDKQRIQAKIDSGLTPATALDPARVDKLIAARRFPSGGDLDDLGLVGRREEVLVLPVCPSGSPEWLLILAGGIDQ